MREGSRHVPGGEASNPHVLPPDDGETERRSLSRSSELRAAVGAGMLSVCFAGDLVTHTIRVQFFRSTTGFQRNQMSPRMNKEITTRKMKMGTAELKTNRRATSSLSPESIPGRRRATQVLGWAVVMRPLHLPRLLPSECAATARVATVVATPTVRRSFYLFLAPY